MKKAFAIFIFFISIKASGQNLVPNQSFESFIECIENNYYITNANGWGGFLSSDYFNSCITPTTLFQTDVPLNYWGFQHPKNGNAYAGAAMYYGSDYREYIYVKVVSPLIANKSYCIGFNVNIADSSVYAVKTIGAFISQDTIVSPYLSTSTPPYYTFNYYSPQIESNTFITDTNGWTDISGIYLAQGNEEIITIGNFRDNAGTDTLRVRNTTAYPYSYYYIDDVSVEEVLNADAGPDAFLMQGDSIQLGNNPTENATYSWFPSTGLSDSNAPNPKASPSSTVTYVLTKTQCNVTTTDTVVVDISVGLDEKIETPNISVFPNPSEGTITLNCNLKNNETGLFVIYDIKGRSLNRFSLEANSSLKTFDLGDLEQGLYLYEVVLNGTSAKKGKLTIIK